MSCDWSVILRFVWQWCFSIHQLLTWMVVIYSLLLCSSLRDMKKEKTRLFAFKPMIFYIFFKLHGSFLPFLLLLISPPFLQLFVQLQKSYFPTFKCFFLLFLCLLLFFSAPSYVDGTGRVDPHWFWVEDIWPVSKMGRVRVIPQIMDPTCWLDSFATPNSCPLFLSNQSLKTATPHFKIDCRNKSTQEKSRGGRRRGVDGCGDRPSVASTESRGRWSPRLGDVDEGDNLRLKRTENDGFLVRNYCLGFWLLSGKVLGSIVQ